jgi:hypothetical protein
VVIVSSYCGDKCRHVIIIVIMSSCCYSSNSVVQYKRIMIEKVFSLA